MNDILEFIDELKELRSLYHSGDLRDFDFNTRIQKYDRLVAKYEEAMDAEAAQHELFFGGTPFAYDPSKEVI